MEEETLEVLEKLGYKQVSGPLYRHKKTSTHILVYKDTLPDEIPEKILEAGKSELAGIIRGLLGFDK